MRFVLLIFILFISSFGMAQNTTEDAAVKKVVDDFFAGFHEADSVAMAATVLPEACLSSVYRKGDSYKLTECLTASNFISTCTSREAKEDWKEIYTIETVKQDGFIAIVWAPYEFHYKGEYSHCGVNTISLMMTDSGWRIFNMADSHRKSCKP